MNQFLLVAIGMSHPLVLTQMFDRAGTVAKGRRRG